MALGLWPATFLEIRAGEGGKLLKAIPVTRGERVTYSYVHSVMKTRVDEVLEVAAGDHLVVRETLYDMFGAGLPSDVPDGIVSIDAATGKFRISQMSRDLPIMRVRVGFVAQQTLEVGAEMIRLDSLAPPTSLLVVGAATRPRIVSLLERRWVPGSDGANGCWPSIGSPARATGARGTSHSLRRRECPRTRLA